MANKTYDPEYLSDCHNARVYVVGDSFGEGTNHYECDVCGTSCNFHVANKTARDILIWYASHAGIIDPEHTDESSRQLFEAEIQRIGEDDKPDIDHHDDGDIEWCTTCGSVTYEGDDGTSWCLCHQKNKWRAEQRAKARTFFNIPETEEGSRNDEATR